MRRDFRTRAVIFDWDGTLVDSLPIKIQNAGHVFFEAFNVPRSKVEEAYRKHSGIARKSLFQALSNELMGRDLVDHEFEDLSRNFSKLNLESKVVLFSEVKQTLEILKSLNLSLFVSSATPPFELKTVADQLGLKPYFLEILGSADGFKKGPEHVQFLSQKYTLDRTKMLAVGDEASDEKLARLSQIEFIGVSRKKEHANPPFEKSKQIHNLLTLAEILP